MKRTSLKFPFPGSEPTSASERRKKGEKGKGTKREKKSGRRKAREAAITRGRKDYRRLSYKLKIDFARGGAKRDSANTGHLAANCRIEAGGRGSRNRSRNRSIRRLVGDGEGERKKKGAGVSLLSAQCERRRRYARREVEALDDLLPEFLVDDVDESSSGNDQIVQLVEVEHRLGHDRQSVDRRA